MCREMAYQLLPKERGMHSYNCHLIKRIREMGSELVEMSSPQQSVTTVFTAEMPEFVFWKNEKFEFIGCNLNFAKACGFDKPQDLIGKTDFDMPWKVKESKHFREDDYYILTQGNSKFNIHETMRQARKNAIIKTSKIPLLNKNGRVFGVGGYFTEIVEPIDNVSKYACVNQASSNAVTVFSNTDKKILSFTDILDRLRTAFHVPLRRRHMLIDNCTPVSTRELQCIFYLLNGDTAKKIAENMNITPKTAESYLESIKTKLNCQTKSELIRKIIDYYYAKDLD